jgi:hypothetical protein
MAIDRGFVVVAGAKARAGAVLAEWDTAPNEEALDLWWRAFRATIEDWDEFDNLWSGIPTAPVAALRLLDGEPGGLTEEEFARRVYDLVWLAEPDVVVLSSFWEVARVGKPMDQIMALLTGYGVLLSANGKVRVSGLGRWALARVAKLTPPVVTREMTAAELLSAVARLDPALGWRRAGRWLGARTPLDAARELLTTASTASPMDRMAALSLAAGLDDGALPAWQEAAELPLVGPGARAFLARELGWGEISVLDTRWRFVDESVALLDEVGAAEALPDIWPNLDGDDATAKAAFAERTGHPDAGRLADQIRRHIPDPAGKPVQRIYQVKITLIDARLPVWRRVQLPGDVPLGALHAASQAAMGWDGDHLHMITVNGRRFSDPEYELDDAMNEWLVDLPRMLPRAGLAAEYLYDFGDHWRHTIEVEKIEDAEAGVTYPRCTAGKGTRPGEDGGAEEDFDIDLVNARFTDLLNQ